MTKLTNNPDGHSRYRSHGPCEEVGLVGGHTAHVHGHPGIGHPDIRDVVEARHTRRRHNLYVVAGSHRQVADHEHEGVAANVLGMGLGHDGHSTRVVVDYGGDSRHDVGSSHEVVEDHGDHGNNRLGVHHHIHGAEAESEIGNDHDLVVARVESRTVAAYRQNLARNRGSKHLRPKCSARKCL